MPGRRIGPIALDARKAGPGHYVVPAATLSPGGDWEILIADRVSEFDEYSTTAEVTVR